MTELEYRTQLAELENHFNIAKYDLGLLFAKKNMKFKKGDIIKDRNSGEIIQVEAIKYVPESYLSRIPTLKYEGQKLKVDFTKTKKIQIVGIFEKNAESVKKG